MTKTYTNRGTYSTFTLTHDASAVIRALQSLKLEGKKVLMARLGGYIAIAINQTKKDIKKMAGNKGGAVPASRGWKRSNTIYDSVAMSLKAGKSKDDTFTIHTGRNLNEAKIGLKGSRGGHIGAILAKGMETFSYGKLPPEVRSSVRWYKASGMPVDTSVGMKMRRNHPGFYDTLDYMSIIERETKLIFKQDMPFALQQLLKRKGFSAKFLSSSIGGRGAFKSS